MAVAPPGFGFNAGICRTRRHRHTSRTANTNDLPGVSSPLSSPSPNRSDSDVSLFSSCADALSEQKDFTHFLYMYKCMQCKKVYQNCRELFRNLRFN